jgi:hypothetical protein
MKARNIVKSPRSSKNDQNSGREHSEIRIIVNSCEDGIGNSGQIVSINLIYMCNTYKSD